MVLSYTSAETQMAYWEEHSQVCGEIRLALAEVKRRTPLAGLRGSPQGTTPRPIVRGTAAGAPPPPPPGIHCLTAWGQWAVHLLQHSALVAGGSGQCNSCNAMPHCLGVWCGVVWCGVVWCGVVWCGVVWCGVVWCGVVWCGVVWCGVVWCGVVWCGVVWCAEGAVTKLAKGRDVYPRAKVNGLGCVCCVRAVCRYVVLGRRLGEAGKTWRAPP